jgi:hypothetical protein
MRFSTTTGWPIRSGRCTASSRAIVSPDPPGPNGTTSLSGFPTIDCADAGAANFTGDRATPSPSRASAAIRERSGIELPPGQQWDGSTVRDSLSEARTGVMVDILRLERNRRCAAVSAAVR